MYMNHKSSEALITLTSEVGLSDGVKITPCTVFNINDYISISMIIYQMILHVYISLRNECIQ